MKKSILSISLILTLLSCNEDNNENIDSLSVTGIWKLSKTISGLSAEQTEANNHTTHSYNFDDSGIVIRKSIIGADVITEINAEYSMSSEHSFYENKDENIFKFIEITYPENSDISFNNCNQDYSKKQLLLLMKDGTIENNLPLACDGNGYKYIKGE